MPSTHFSKVKLERAVLEKNLSDLRCAHCEPDAEEANRAERHWTCQRCGKDKLVLEFVWAVQQTTNAHKKVCRDCQYPSCSVCGERRQTARFGREGNTEVYTCLGCKYPPCAACGRARPRLAGYTKDELPEWHCKTCKSSVDCSVCGTTLKTKAAEHVQDEIICKDCNHARKYPPCMMCGKKRPNKERYHVTNMPLWTCQVCLKKKI